MGKNKRAAIEMTTGTIIVIVLAVLMLVFGSIFVRNVMCSGINIVEDVSQMTSKQVKDLFGSSVYGVVCTGEGNEQLTLGTGGTRHVTCTFNVDEATHYELSVDEIESLKGATDAQVENWIVKKDWEGDMRPNAAVNTVSVLEFDIPRTAPKTLLAITLTETSDINSDPLTHDIRVTIEPVGAVAGTIC